VDENSTTGAAAAQVYVCLSCGKLAADKARLGRCGGGAVQFPVSALEVGPVGRVIAISREAILKVKLSRLN